MTVMVPGITTQMPIILSMPPSGICGMALLGKANLTILRFHPIHLGPLPAMSLCTSLNGSGTILRKSARISWARKVLMQSRFLRQTNILHEMSGGPVTSRWVMTWSAVAGPRLSFRTWFSVALMQASKSMLIWWSITRQVMEGAAPGLAAPNGV